MAKPSGVFVAGAWAEKDDRVKLAIASLRRAGVKVTHDWTKDADRGDHDADKDLAGIDAASTVLFLIPKDAAASQAWSELGYALAQGKHVVVSGTVRDWMIYAKLADKKFKDDADAYRYVRDRERGRTKTKMALTGDDVVKLDLSPGDVQGPAGNRGMSEISTRARRTLPEQKFALPSKRKFPLPDAAHVRNAAARLEQVRKAGKISDSDYQTARANIARAAKKFGIDSKFNKRSSRAFHIRADIASGGSLHVRHMADANGVLVVLPPIDLTGSVGD